MPLLRRSEYKLRIPPEGLKPGCALYYLPLTGEGFPSYSEYTKARRLYETRAWTCSSTGKSGLTYAEAAESEKQSFQRIAGVPKPIMDLIVSRFNMSTQKFDDIVAEIAQVTNSRFFEDEEVRIRGKDERVFRIIKSPWNQSNLIGTDQSAQLHYELQAAQNSKGKTVTVKSGDLKRVQAFTKSYIRFILRNSLIQPKGSKMWTLKAGASKGHKGPTLVESETAAMKSHSILDIKSLTPAKVDSKLYDSAETERESTAKHPRKRTLKDCSDTNAAKKPRIKGVTRLKKAEVLHELEELGAPIKFNSLKELKEQLAKEREKKERLLEREALKEQRREAKRKEKEERKAQREAEIMRLKRYPIEDMLVVKEDEEHNAILRKQGLQINNRPSFPDLEIFPEEYIGEAIQVCESLELVSIGVHYDTPPKTLLELRKTIIGKSPSERERFKTLYQSLLETSVSSLYESSFEGLGDDGARFSFPPLWKTLSRESCWQEILRRKILYGFFGISFRIVEESNLLSLTDALQKRSFTALSLDQHFSLLRYLCDDLLDLDFVREKIDNNFAKMIDLTKARAEEIAEERRVFKELEDAEKEARREEREKTKMENQEIQAQGTDNEEFSELRKPATEISTSIRNFEGDPNDRKAILAHRKKVAVAEAKLQAEWETFEKKQRALKRARAMKEAAKEAKILAANEKRQREKTQKQAEKEKKEDSYYREIAKNSIRCQALGENRFGHRYWWFTCEKESVFVERGPSRWGRYTKKADIDQLLEALDERGIRERKLKEEIQRQYRIITSGMKRNLNESSRIPNTFVEKTVRGKKDDQKDHEKQLHNEAVARLEEFHNLVSGAGALVEEGWESWLDNLSSTQVGNLSQLSMLIQRLERAIVDLSRKRKRGLKEFIFNTYPKASQQINGLNGSNENLDIPEFDFSNKCTDLEIITRQYEDMYGEVDLIRDPRRFWKYEWQEKLWSDEIRNCKSYFMLLYQFFVLVNQSSRMLLHYFPTFEAESDLMRAILSPSRNRKEAKVKSTNPTQARQHSIPERFELKNDDGRARYLVTNFKLLDDTQTSTIPLHILETNRWRPDAERVRYVLEGDVVMHDKDNPEMPSSKLGKNDKLFVQINVVDWLVDFSKVNFESPTVWLQSDAGALFKILEPSHGYRKCGKAFFQLRLAYRALQILKRQPYISYLEAVSKVLGNDTKRKDFEDSAAIILGQLVQHFVKDHRIGLQPLHSGFVQNLIKTVSLNGSSQPHA